MYSNVKLSSAQAREIAFDLYDFIIQGVKEMEEGEIEKKIDNQKKLETVA